jgi:toluene monooxygenase system protein E
MSRQVAPMKTYSHLAGSRRVPSEYEIVSTALLYHPQRGFEVDVPARRWYERYQRDSKLTCSDWERFADPRATTYPAYTALQGRQEAHLDGVLRSWEAADHEPARLTLWSETFLRTLAPLRFALHGFQMLAAYVGQMAPSGRLAMAALFQTGDELRRVHRIAYHMGLLRRARPFTDDPSRAAWQTDPAWQPLRRTVEQALVTFDWGEALVALNLSLKPLVEALFLTELAPLLREQRDFLGGEVLSSFDEDGRWHQAWSAAAVRLAVNDRAENGEVIQGWINSWYPRALEATGAAASLLGEAGPPALARAQARSRAGLQMLGLRAP